MMKRLSFIFIVFLMMGYLSSCSQKLPVAASDENGVLVIPITSRNFTQYPNGYYYNFLYSPETQIKIEAVPLGSRKFVIIDRLPPGEYKINGIKSISSPSRGIAMVNSDIVYFNQSIPVQIRPNEITLLEYMFSVEQKYPDSTAAIRYSQGYMFKPLNKSQYDQIVSDLQNLPNAEHWNLAHLPAMSTTDQDNGITSANMLYLNWPVWGRN